MAKRRLEIPVSFQRRRRAHPAKARVIATFRANRKNGLPLQGGLMGKAMAIVNYLVNARFRHLIGWLIYFVSHTCPVTIDLRGTAQGNSYNQYGEYIILR